MNSVVAKMPSNLETFSISLELLFPEVINALFTYERLQWSNKFRKCWFNKVKQFLSCRILRALTTKLFIINTQEEEILY